MAFTGTIHSHLSDDGQRIITHAHDENGKAPVGVPVSHEGLRENVYREGLA